MVWAGQLGRDYTARNQGDRDALCQRLYGITATELNQRFLGPLPRGMSIMEVGCNIGTNLLMLRDMGFHDLTGVDIEPTALAQAEASGLRVVNANAASLPFKDESFGLVFTSGVLIHIPPDDLETVMGEIVRVSKRYVWLLEYFNPTLIAAEYRRRMGLMWKGDYTAMFQGMGLKVLDETFLRYESGDLDKMALLEKP
jgi:pseudaminic acid biosynthesis-associated methylase